MQVRTQDGRVLGRVVAIGPEGIRVRKGFIISRRITLGFGDLDHVAADVVVTRTRANLDMSPGALQQARMDSAKFQDHGRSDVSPQATTRPSAFEEARMDSAKFQDHQSPGVDPGGHDPRHL